MGGLGGGVGRGEEVAVWVAWGDCAVDDGELGDWGEAGYDEVHLGWRVSEGTREGVRERTICL